MEEIDSRKKSIFITIITLLFINIVGIILIVVGFSLRNDYKIETKDYIETKAKFMYYEEDDSYTYYLFYEYTVDGESYLIKSNMATSIVPTIESERTVIYDVDNPNRAELVGFENYIFLFVLGLMFTLITSIMIVRVLVDSKDLEDEESYSYNVIITYGIGLFFLLVPYLMIYAISGEPNVLNINKYVFTQYINNRRWISVGILDMFMLVGVYLIVANFFISIKNRKEKIKY